jgi:hypothetical protein
MALTKDERALERETVVRWDCTDGPVSVWSADPKVWRKMARLAISPVKETTRDGEPSGKFYKIPLEVFRWGLKSQARKGNINAFKRAQPPNA